MEIVFSISIFYFICYEKNNIIICRNDFRILFL